jgi:hypothetical protein
MAGSFGVYIVMYGLWCWSYRIWALTGTKKTDVMECSSSGERVVTNFGKVSSSHQRHAYICIFKTEARFVFSLAGDLKRDAESTISDFLGAREQME